MTCQKTLMTSGALLTNETRLMCAWHMTRDSCVLDLSNGTHVCYLSAASQNVSAASTASHGSAASDGSAASNGSAASDGSAANGTSDASAARAAKKGTLDLSSHCFSMHVKKDKYMKRDLFSSFYTRATHSYKKVTDVWSVQFVSCSC